MPGEMEEKVYAPWFRELYDGEDVYTVHKQSPNLRHVTTVRKGGKITVEGKRHYY